ncbi:LemA family protein [Altererythrobacter sp. ZODW24]|uniref:LemA family protein n=1 Tax=Altererythrobacter sp. ZODW24 TaxID=2185142 RepID=UPI0013B4582A|nr:LemA family protein [Altererythrobacter sp. ZODW24]
MLKILASAAQTGGFAEDTDLYNRSVESTNFFLDNWYIWFFTAVLVIMLYIIWVVHANIQAMDERVEASYGDLDAILAERHALIPNLVETVKAFASQEHKVLKDVIDARASAMRSAGNEKLKAEGDVGQSLMNLLAITEQYPELASSERFGDLQNELTHVEQRVTAARRFYNLSVEELYAYSRAFPGNVIAKFSRIGEHDKFSLGEQRDELSQPVKVSFQ